MKTMNFLFVFFTCFVFGQVKVGDKMPTFTLLNNANEKVSNTVFIEKYILIDFWASWCAPCRLGNKKLVQLFKEVNQDKIEIIGISLDSDKSKWLKAVEKDKIKYQQLIDPKGFEAKTAIEFGVDELPSTFLFNREGILIAKNPSNEDIIKLIKK
jgi:peroxiredoxin